MRFLSLSNLRSDIASGGLTEQEVSMYLLACFSLFFLGCFPSAGGMVLTPASYVFWLVSSLLSLWGIRAACVANGGAKGVGFVGKFLALGWVLGLRGLIFFVPLYLLLFALASMVMALAGLLQSAGVKGFQAAAQYALYVALLLYVAWYYWRLSINLMRLKAGE